MDDRDNLINLLKKIIITAADNGGDIGCPHEYGICQAVPESVCKNLPCYECWETTLEALEDK